MSKVIYIGTLSRYGHTCTHICYTLDTQRHKSLIGHAFLVNSSCSGVFRTYIIYVCDMSFPACFCRGPP